jgi:hypothetical protein
MAPLYRFETQTAFSDTYPALLAQIILDERFGLATIDPINRPRTMVESALTIPLDLFSLCL